MPPCTVQLHITTAPPGRATPRRCRVPVEKAIKNPAEKAGFSAWRAGAAAVVLV